MFPSRRGFLGFAAAWTGAIALGARAQGQADTQGGSVAYPPDPFDRPAPDDPNFNTRELLESNAKGVKKDVARLSELVQQLQKQLEHDDTKNILSLDVLRETDEIDKLAKHISMLVRG